MKRPLEEDLGNYIIELEAVGEDKRISRLEREEAERVAEERRREREAEAERNRIEAERVDHLRQLAAEWREARELREFLEVVEAKESRSEEVMQWVRWGHSVADHLDPVLNREYAEKIR